MPGNRYAAAILSGGNSLRMGYDKQQIAIDGLLLREYQIEMLKSLFEQVIVVSNNPSLYDSQVLCVKDILPFSCPLSGIHSALSNTTCDGVFVIACDMPIIDINLIKDMIKTFEDSCCDVCIPAYDDFYEPLYGIYNKNCKKSIEHYLNLGNRKILTYIDSVRFKPYNVTDKSVFINLNQPSDLLKLEVINGIIMQKKY